MSEYGTVCQVCGASDWRPPRHCNVLGQGLDLIECAACGVRCYNRPARIVPEVFYRHANYDAYVARDAACGSPLNREAEATARYESSAAATYAFALTRARGLAGEPFATLYEVGCGVGRLLREARRMGLRTFGCDANARNVEIARQHGEVAEGFFSDVSLPAEPVDCVAMFDVIEHSATPGADLRRARSICRPGGALVVQTFFDEWHDGLEAFDVSPARNLDRSFLVTGYFCPVSHPHHFTRPALRGAVGRTGWAFCRDRASPASGIQTVWARAT